MARLLAVALLAAVVALASAAVPVHPFPLSRSIQVCEDVTGQVNLGEVGMSLHLDVPPRDGCRGMTLADGQIGFVIRGRDGALAHLITLVDAVMFVDAQHSFAVVAVSPLRLEAATRAMERLDAHVLASKPATSKPRPVGPIRLPKTPKQLATKDEILNSLDEKEYATILGAISGNSPLVVDGESYLIKTRYTGTEQNEIAAEYMLRFFEDLGLEASYQEFRYNGMNVRNVIGIKRGSSPDIVVVGAHMDSTSPSPSSQAPGAIDNGSGSVGVLLAAQAFANVTTTHTIHFILFGVEEQGLIGSEYYVSQLDANGYNVVSALIMDMIGYSDRYVGVMIEGVPDVRSRFLSLYE